LFALTPAGVLFLAMLVASGLTLLAMLLWQGLPTGLGYARTVATLAGPTPANEIQDRAFLIGLNGGVNLVLGIALYGSAFGMIGAAIGTATGGPAGLAIGVAIGVIAAIAISLALLAVTALAVIAPSNAAAKGVIGWIAPFVPSAWPVVAIGSCFLIADLILHPIGVVVGFFGGGTTFTLEIQDVGWDPVTNSHWHQGGLTADLNSWGTAYNLGPFILADSVFATWPARLDHEIGHHLALTAFGSTFHMLGWFNQVGAGGGGYAEDLAESNAGAGTPITMWT